MNERDRELRETRALYVRLQAHQDAFGETVSSFCLRFAGIIGEFPEGVRDEALIALWYVVAAERQIWELPEPAFGQMTMADFVEYRNILYAKEHFFANYGEHLRLLEEGVTRIFGGIAAQISTSEGPSPFSVPLIHAIAEPRKTVNRIYGTIAEYVDRGLFAGLAAQFSENICRVSGRDPNDPHAKRPIIPAQDSSLPLDELVSGYTGETPFEDLLNWPVPLQVSRETRFGHMHVVGGSGSGKTTLIENLIRHDLASNDPPSIVLIDPHSDLVRRLVRSDLGIEDRLILIDPRDIAFPLALNPFALNQERLHTYDEGTREQVTAGVIQTFGYLWSGLTNLSLTGKQEVLFRYVTRLMLSLPDTMGRNATILDMLRLMKCPKPYTEAIEALPEIPRDFFNSDFAIKGFEATREQIRYRLQAIIENPTMARLFTAPETKIDFFTEMNRGAVILVDTAKDFLKEGSGVFGKLLISLILQAVMERAAIPEGERKPTFIMVDEAGSFFSNNIDDLLTEARKYKAGLLLAHQYLEQATPSLRASLAANTAIKFASGLSAADASAMARDMRTTPDFILAQPKLSFAAYIRGVTPGSVTIPIMPTSGASQLTSDAYDRLIARNRARVSLAGTSSSLPILPAYDRSVGEDISPEWK